MGTVSSISKDINNKKNDSQDESSEYEYKGLNSIKNINNKNLSQGQSETAENTKIDLSDQKISYKFEWKEGGNDVKIAGSFLDDWNRQEEMKKNLNTGIYEIIIQIPRGIHQFKFIVDKKWTCSQYYKIIYDKMNNANNIIDLTNYIPSNINENNNNTHIKKKKKKSGKNTIEYNCNFPDSNEVNLEAPILPMHFRPSFDLNLQTYQESLQNYFKIPVSLDKNKIFLENNTFKTIITISHEKILHLCYNNEKYNNDKNFIRTAITQRNKHKFITIVYYSPKKG